MKRPQVGFLGIGWIGRHRMAAMLATGAIDAAWLCDPDADCLAAARALAPQARVVPSLAAMLAERPDGIVIATPSALHADQAIAALAAGAHVFCQKPLGRDLAEVDAVLAAAEHGGRTVSVDFSYRHFAAFRAVKALVDDGELGELLAIEAVFHNGYGPGKAWFHDRVQSGGGCLIDLGVHLIDLIGQLTRERPVAEVQARLLQQGAPCAADGVESFAAARLLLAGGPVCDLRCSWHAHIGADCEIALVLHGTAGGAAIRNVGGSFFDFEARHHHGTSSALIAAPPDDWGGRAAAAWAHALTAPAQDRQLRYSAAVCDAIYAAAR